LKTSVRFLRSDAATPPTDSCPTHATDATFPVTGTSPDRMQHLDYTLNINEKRYSATKEHRDEGRHRQPRGDASTRCALGMGTHCRDRRARHHRRDRRPARVPSPNLQRTRRNPTRNGGAAWGHLLGPATHLRLPGGAHLPNPP